ncbi:uncharacterized protein LOC131604491 [Vicia villosa]|uniref:uncharacterized protein LOC131604491 n=1 Tax=Vicia villosa TaxID=3911 RepID=UPI00273CBBEF|nr:uncharacterized protein LOC131604491 [Vicia villosa]
MSQYDINIRWYVASVFYYDGKTFGRTLKLNDYTLLDDIIDEVHYPLPYGDKRKIVKLKYRSLSVDNEGKVVYNNFELKNREDVLTMWRTYFDFEEKIPLKLVATISLKKDGFSVKWRKWIEALVFNSSMSVLVNGSPTREFSITRGLRQGDPLSPFLFLLVAEGLTAMVKVASSLGDFKGFSLDDHQHFEILQFADDTILIGEDSWNNLWTFKAILRGFELVSGLRVNLNKSRLFGVNLDPDFIQVGSSFLNCAIGSSSFVFLSIPVGVNPRRCDVWKPLISRLRRRIGSWYEDIQRILIKDTFIHPRSKVSLWWRDLVSVGRENSSTTSNWFNSSISCKLGTGLFFEFWFDAWLGTMPLGILFPELLSLSEAPHSKVAEMGSWNGEIWSWNLGIFCETEDRAAAMQLNQLVILLAPFQPCRLIGDSFVWWRNPSGFTVSNAYDTILLLDLLHPPLENSFSSLFSCLWKTKVPSRIHLFGWRLIWNRLPTKVELAKRGILVAAQLLKCPLCNRVDEDLDHLFLHCHIVRT